MSRLYGVDVSNRFALNLEDEDPGDPNEIIAQSSNSKQPKKPAKEVAGDKPKQQKQVSGPTLPSVRPATGTRGPRNDAQDQGEKPDQQTQVKKASSGWMTVTGHTRHNRSTKQRDNKSISESVEEANKKNEQLSFHDGRIEIIPRRGRGGGAPRFFRGSTRGKGDSQPLRGKREFDRLSGSTKSGVKPVEKRDGGGAHNWGRPVGETEFPDAEERSSDEGTAPSELKEEPSHEKDKDKSMTLDEWKLKQEKRNIPAFNLRKPGEGETEKWSDTYILKKKEKEEEEEEEEEASCKKGKQKQHLDPSLLFTDLKIGSSSAKTAKKNLPAAKQPQLSNPKSSSDLPGKHEAPKMDDFDDFPKL